MTKLFAVLIIINLLACDNKKKVIIVQRVQDFILVDTSSAPNTFLERNEENCYPIYFMGLKDDTIRISRQYSVKRPKWKVYDSLLTASTTRPNNFSLYVDTISDFNAPMEYFTEERTINEDSTKDYHSYLFILKNIGDSTLNLGISYYLLRVHREVLNANGEWMELDKNYEPLICGYGQPDIYLFKNEIILSKIRRYKGDTVAAFRMNYGYSDRKVYSNIFYDRFDKRSLRIEPTTANSR